MHRRKALTEDEQPTKGSSKSPEATQELQKLRYLRFLLFCFEEFLTEDNQENEGLWGWNPLGH
jgi:hypothetical protein